MTPWLESPNTSERYFPIFVGASPRDLVLGRDRPTSPRLPDTLKIKAESRVPLLIKMTGHDSFTVQAWPSVDENGQFDWVFARWKGTDNSWEWFTTEDAHRYRGKHNHRSQLDLARIDPMFPLLLHPSNASDEQLIFADFLELPGLYDQPLYGNCVYADHKTKKISHAWPNPNGSDRSALREIFSQRGAFDAYCMNPPTFFNDRYVVFNLSVEHGSLKWPSGIEWSTDPSSLPPPIDHQPQVKSWPSTYTADYERDIKIADGESPAKLPNGKALKPFIKKGSFQVGHDLERMVDYLEVRYKELGIPIQRQRFMWRGLPQSNLIALIAGQDENAAPVVLADHIDSAVAEDTFNDSGQRVTTPGANDNSTATATLLQAAKILRVAHPKRPIWLVHLTGEEFPAVDLGARHFLSEILRSKKDIYGVVITDFIGSHQPGSRRFQISPTAVSGSERFAAMALDAAGDMFLGDVEAIYQARNKMRNSVFQTDLLEFEFRGFPGILFNADMDYSRPETNNPHYHQSTDVVANIDLDFSAKVSRIAIESALRMAND
jgi:hypothetical protein